MKFIKRIDPELLFSEPAAQQILQLCICNCATVEQALEQAKRLGDSPPPRQLFWLIQLCWQVLPVSCIAVFRIKRIQYQGRVDKSDISSFV